LTAIQTQVINESGKLMGLISIKDLVVEPPEKKISEIMNPEVISVNVRMDQEKVANLFKKYDLAAIPVVDDYNRLLGRITHDDIICFIRRNAHKEDTSFYFINLVPCAWAKSFAGH